MMIVNTTDYEIRRAREELAASLGGIDAKRPAAWDQYGYKAALTFEDYYRAYERTGAGNGAVHRILDGCWQSWPRVKKVGEEAETEWERKTKNALKKFWPLLKDFDRRNMVGRFSALIYRVADGRKLHEELGRGALVDLVPVYEGEIKVTRWDEDESSPTYGKPLMFQYLTSKPGASDMAKPSTWVNVHHSRVQIMAEGSTNGDFTNGVPLLKAGFNHLVDIEKISGGSGESFLKNSARTVVFEYDAQATVQAIGDDGKPNNVRKAHEEQARALNRNQDSSIVMQGGKANTLQTAIADPTGPATMAMNLFAASVRLPFTIIFGQQTGRLASDEDKEDANARYKARQTNELTPMIEAAIARMQAIGWIDQGEFEIEWPDVAAPTDKQRIELLNGYTKALREAYQSGVPDLFDADELRDVVGFDKRVDPLGMKGEGDPT